MAENSRSVNKPLSSASEIMNRHAKKRKKWYQTLLHGDGRQAQHKKPGAKDEMHKGVSRSLENVGHLNLSVIGIRERASSATYLPAKDDDSLSTASLSSSESETADVFGGSCSKRRRSFKNEPRSSSASSDNEMTSENEFLETSVDDDADKELTSNKNISDGPAHLDLGFSNILYNYLPFGFSPAASRSSSESLISQSEEKKTLEHLIQMSADSDQVSLLFPDGWMQACRLYASLGSIHSVDFTLFNFLVK